MINTLDFWTVTFFIGLGTLSIRGSFIFLSDRIRLTENFKKILTFIPAAIIPALITPMVFFDSGQVEWLWGKEKMILLALSTVVCFLSRSMFIAIVFGLVALYVLRYF